MEYQYILGLILSLGIVQGTDPSPGHGQAAIIEDLRNGASRVIAGWPAADGQIPYQVSVRMINPIGTVNSCGGSIIHHQWVISAAHCLANRLTFVIRLGLTNLTQPQYIVETTRKHLHPRYIEILGGVQLDDIALLGLEQSIPYGEFIQPCRLQNSADRNTNYVGQVLTVSGYGLTDDVVNGGAVSERLLWVLLRGITNAECLGWYSDTLIDDQIICAEYYNHTEQSPCNGDSGGPLTIVDEDGLPTMVGLVSFGSLAGCNSIFPTAFVRPGHYHEWFEDVTGINFDWSNGVEKLNPTSILLILAVYFAAF